MNYLNRMTKNCFRNSSSSSKGFFFNLLYKYSLFQNIRSLTMIFQKKLDSIRSKYVVLYPMGTLLRITYVKKRRNSRHVRRGGRKKRFGDYRYFLSSHYSVVRRAIVNQVHIRVFTVATRSDDRHPSVSFVSFNDVN